MWTTARRTAVLISFLAGCTGDVGEARRAFVEPVTGGEDDGGAAGGTSAADATGAAGAAGDGGVGSTGATGATTGGTTGATTGGATGATTGGATGATTGGATGATTGGATGATTGGATGATTTGGAPGATTGATTGGATGATNGVDAGVSTGVDAGIPSTPGVSQTDPCGNGTEAITKGLKIREISLYQAVKIPLMTGGTWVATRRAPVVQGKKALVRAFVDTLSGYVSHNVRGVLTIDNGTPKQIPNDMKPTAASTDAAMASTFNFNVDPADIGPNTKLSVVLVDPTCTNALGKASDARFPATGTQALAATKVNKLRVVLVPVNYGTFKPDLSAAQIQKVREQMIAHYPIMDIDLTVRQGAITATSKDFSTVLNQVTSTRRADNPAGDVYYYGVWSPAASFNTFCNGGCTLGVAWVTSASGSSNRAGLGVGFPEYFASTMVHEIGHNHGREHAPCGGVSSSDPSFPTSGGGIGGWGWNSLTNALQDPAKVKDVMGYCDPAWVSEYTYNALATRSLAVNTVMRVSLNQGPEWQSIMLLADGTEQWTTVTAQGMPGDDVELALVLDASGQVIDEVEVVRVSIDHLDDAMLYIPEPQLGWHALQLADRTVIFDQISDAL